MEFRLQKYLALMILLVVTVSACTTVQNQGTTTQDDSMMENDVMEDEAMEETNNGMDDGSMMEDKGMTDEAMEEDTMMEGNVVTFQLDGGNFYFEMDGERAPELRVNKGDTVRIEFTSVDGFHDWVLDEFDAATERVSTGGTTVVEFVADQEGTFEYYCSVGSHRAAGMFGTFIVE